MSTFNLEMSQIFVTLTNFVTFVQLKSLQMQAFLGKVFVGHIPHIIDCVGKKERKRKHINTFTAKPFSKEPVSQVRKFRLSIAI